MTADLREETAALLLGLSGGSDVIALAADLLAKGHNSQPLLALASLYPSATSADVVVLISTVLTEAGDPPLDRESDEFPLLALRDACRPFLDGELDLRAFTSWAHTNIGHDGPEAAQPIVEADDVLDDLYATQGSPVTVQHRDLNATTARTSPSSLPPTLHRQPLGRRVNGSCTVRSPVGRWTEGRWCSRPMLAP